MQLKEIISVPGMGGLYKVVASNKGGVIVESLQDSKRTMISATQRIMTLTDIALYVKDGEMPLREVFKMVPPRTWIPAVTLRVSLMISVGSFRTPLKASMVPNTSQSLSFLARLATPRITALSPGQSPPPVSTKILFFFSIRSVKSNVLDQGARLLRASIDLG